MKIYISVSSESLKFKVDNPGGKWLEEEQALCDKKGFSSYGGPNRFGPVTAWFNRAVLVPVSVLKNLKGLRAEQSNVRPKDLESLHQYASKHQSFPKMDSGGTHNPFIQVWHDGTPYVNEGNHRIMMANQRGWKFVPIEIRYFSGGELSYGPLTPRKVSDYDSKALKEGYSLTDYGKSI